MKKFLFNKSAVALAAGLFAACAAQAYVTGSAANVNGVAPATQLGINAGGIGHSLFVPYYTAQGGNRTYLNIINTDMRNGKAVKVRFRGASNSDDVLDFTVWLSPGDAWSAVVFAASGSNPARLQVVEGDTTCTTPAIPADGVEFRTFRLHPHLTPDILASETREGYIEIFNEADIPPTTAPANNATRYTLYRAIEHVNGKPRDCAAVQTQAAALVETTYGVAAAATNLSSTGHATNTTSVQDVAMFSAANTGGAGALADARLRGFDVPTTGLYATWAIANTGNGRSWSGAATAVQAVLVNGADTVPGYGNIVYHPQVPNTVPIGVVRQATADPLLRGGVLNNEAAIGTVEVVNGTNTNVNQQINAQAGGSIATQSVDLPDMSTPYLQANLANLANGVATRTQAYNLTRALATRSVSNEYLTVSGVGVTDWVFTFPTRRYNVARAYATAASGNEGTGTTLFTDYRTTDASAAGATNDALLPGIENYFTSTFNGATGNVVSDTFVTRRHQLCVNGITFAGTGKTDSSTAGAEAASPAFGSNRVGGTTGNRDETFNVSLGGIDFSPAPTTPGQPPFCGEAGVFAFNNGTNLTTGAVGAQVSTRNIATTATGGFGWMRIATPGVGTGPKGLPVVGYAFGALGNLSVVLPHKNVLVRGN